MADFSYTRLTELLEILLISDAPVSSREFSRKLNISQRTLRSDIRNLKDELASFDVAILQKRGQGYYLSYKKVAQVNQLKEYLSSTSSRPDSLESASDRISHLFKLLLIADSFQSAESLMDTLFISKNTLYNYLKAVREILSAHDLSLLNRTNIGFKVAGEEIDKRNCLLETLVDRNHSSYIVGFTKKEKHLFQNIDLDALYSTALPQLMEICRGISDYAVKNILLHIAVSVSRISQKQSIPSFDFQLMIEDRKKMQIKKLLQTIAETAGIALPESEKNYICYHMTLNDTSLIASDVKDNPLLISSFIDALVDQIFSAYRFDLRNDYLLKENLFQHLQATLRLKKISNAKENPLLETIRTAYALAYEITLTASRSVAHDMDIALSISEIAYITLHIGASLERNYPGKNRKKRIALVCGSGKATAALLEAKLLARFHDTIEIAGKYSFYEYTQKGASNADLIISTLPLQDKDRPVIVIDIHSFEKDSRKLQDVLHTGTEEQFHGLFTVEQIFLNEKFPDKTAVLDFLCRNHEEEAAGEDFKTSIRQREALAPTTIGNGIAIPHPMALVAGNRSSVAVMTLKEPIDWGNGQKADLIFLLSISKSEYPKIQKLFEFFSIMQEDKVYKDSFMKCSEPEETLRLIHGFDYHQRLVQG